MFAGFLPNFTETTKKALQGPISPDISSFPAGAWTNAWPAHTRLSFHEYPK